MNSSLEHLQTVAIIADTSDSAAPYWREVVSTIQQLLKVLPENSVKAIYRLGTHAALPPTYFADKDVPSPGQGGSFITPIVKRLKRDRTKVQIAIIVGSGEIFDLADWLASLWVERWALVEVGNVTLKPSSVEASVFKGTNLAPLIAWLNTLSAPKEVRRKQPLSAWNSGSAQWALDDRGYPLIYVPPLNVYLHLFPITKFQFEEFLVERCSSYGDAWYEELLKLNPRLSYRTHNFDLYEQLFLTGIIPSEANHFARWLGRDYDFLSIAEWQSAYQWLDQQEAGPPQPQLTQMGMIEAAHEIWERFYNQLSPKTLLELSLMSRGIIEWVRDKQSYIGLGRTRPEFVPQLRNPLTPFTAISTTTRIKEFGFRLRKQR